MTGTLSESDRLEHLGDDGNRTLLRASSPGPGRITHPQSGWSSFVRISRRGYVGRGIFRFQEEVQDDDVAPLFLNEGNLSIAWAKAFRSGACERRAGPRSGSS